MEPEEDYEDLIEEAEQAFLEDPSYAILIAERASGILARRKARASKSE